MASPEPRSGAAQATGGSQAPASGFAREPSESLLLRSGCTGLARLLHGICARVVLLTRAAIDARVAALRHFAAGRSYSSDIGEGFRRQRVRASPTSSHGPRKVADHLPAVSRYRSTRLSTLAERGVAIGG